MLKLHYAIIVTPHCPILNEVKLIIHFPDINYMTFCLFYTKLATLNVIQFYKAIHI